MERSEIQNQLITGKEKHNKPSLAPNRIHFVDVEPETEAAGEGSEHHGK